MKQIKNCPPGYSAEELGVADDCVIKMRQMKEKDGILKVPEGVTEVKEEDVTN